MSENLINENDMISILLNARKSYENVNQKDINLKEIINIFKEKIISNQKEIEQIIMIENNYNDNQLNFEEILKIIDNQIFIDKPLKTIEEVKTIDGFIKGKYYDSLGVLGVIYNGDIYVTIKMMLMAINTKNAMIFCTNNKLYAINKMLVLIMQQILKEININENLIQVINSVDYVDMYGHDSMFDQFIVIGNKNMQVSVWKKCGIPILNSGYNCFDFYIEDVLDYELIKKILEIKNIDLNLYINKKISAELTEKLNIEDYTEIENVEECIRDIKLNSAKYSSSIMTKDKENASKFLKMVKSKNVFINASPTVERSLDIDEGKLTCLKQVMY